MFFTSMRYVFIVNLAAISQITLISATPVIATPIFSDKTTLNYFEKIDNVVVECIVKPANGSSPQISSSAHTIKLGTKIPNSLKEFYELDSQFMVHIKTLMPDDYYLMIEETIMEPNSRGKIRSFIGAYARDIKAVTK